MPSSRLILFVVLVSATALGACGGRNHEVIGGEDILLAGGPSLMGEYEERARGFLLDMAFVLESNMDRPERALDRFQALLAVNGAAMLENARALQERFEAMEGAERRLYEAQLARFLAEANGAWRDQSNTFHSQHSEVGNQIFRIVEEFDR